MRRTAIGMLMGAMLLGSSSSAFAQDNTVNERQRNQQKRIGEGVENGSLTAGEAARLEKQEAAIHHEVKTERTANGGRLTAQERRQVTRQQNRESKRIYKQKHDAQHQ
jgi:methionine-rich copper-binding protein CopC